MLAKAGHGRSVRVDRNIESEIVNKYNRLGLWQISIVSIARLNGKLSLHRLGRRTALDRRRNIQFCHGADIVLKSSDRI